jgi:hypothetical protein
MSSTHPISEKSLMPQQVTFALPEPAPVDVFSCGCGPVLMRASRFGDFGRLRAEYLGVGHARHTPVWTPPLIRDILEPGRNASWQKTGVA